MPRISGRNRKEELLDAARDLIFTEGSARFTIRRLAERVELTEAAIYRHFSSKEQLLLALLARTFATWQTEVPALLESSSSPDERLMQLADFHLHTLLHSHFNPILLLSDATDPSQEALRLALAEIATALYASIHRLVKEGKQSGCFAATVPPDVGTMAILGIIQHTVIQWTLTRQAEGLATRMRQTLRFLLDTFRCPPTGPSHPAPKGASPSRRRLS